MMSGAAETIELAIWFTLPRTQSLSTDPICNRKLRPDYKFCDWPYPYGHAHCTLAPDRRPRARAQHEGYEPHRAAQLFVRFSYELERDAITHGFNGVPTGIRTPVASVKGMCPRPLDDGEAGLEIDRTETLKLVEPGGIEPPTSCMPCKRSPS